MNQKPATKTERNFGGLIVRKENDKRVGVKIEDAVKEISTKTGCSVASIRFALWNGLTLATPDGMTYEQPTNGKEKQTT